MTDNFPRQEAQIKGAIPPRIRTFSPLDKPIGFSRWLLSGFGESVHPARSFSSQPEPKEPIAAYYTLVSSTVEKHDIPFDRSLPRQKKIAVLLLVRLAVDKSFQKHGLDGKTLITALRKSRELTQAGLPALGLVLDVLDEEALAFYQHYDFFLPFPGDPMRLFVPMAALEEI